MGYGGIGFGIFLVALGAILRYAVTAELAGVDIGTVGVILMVAGLVVFVLSLFFVFWDRQSDYRRATGAAPAGLLARRSSFEGVSVHGDGPQDEAVGDEREDRPERVRADGEEVHEQPGECDRDREHPADEPPEPARARRPPAERPRPRPRASPTSSGSTRRGPSRGARRCR